MQSTMTTETIAAIATAPGAAGLAVVRLSGPDALRVAASVFDGADLATAPTHTLHHGWAVWPRGSGDAAAAAPASRATTARAASRRLDEVVAAVFCAPRSYTREDVVEFSCHGGRMPAERVLAALLRAGARLATPGEFTLRAFINGRVDLAQAEAVADLIHAETDRARELAVAQLAGSLSRRLDSIADRLTDAAAEVEARVDFAEDVGGIEVPQHVVDAIAAVDAELSDMLEGAAYARAVREGVRVPLVGRPNVGKSSLFNALVGEDRAIVTDTPGTTRDRVSEAIELSGVQVTLSDTAGLRESEEAVEAMGMARAREAVDEAAVVLWVVDGAEPLHDDDRRIAAGLADRPVVVALNKRDTGARVAAGDVEPLLNGQLRRVVEVSAKTGEGIRAIRDTLAEVFGANDARPGWGSAAGNRRHAEALSRSREALGRATEAAAAGSPGEIVALELREALLASGEVTGRTVGDDLLDRIFSRFCIGK